jgi:hypothetical protein
MIVRRIAALAAGIALALAPFAANAQVMLVRGCLGGTHLLVLPGDPVTPRRDNGDGCAKACHAAVDRRGKPVSSRKGCC